MNAHDSQELQLGRIGTSSMGSWKDRLGIFASVACAIHCAATPILLATLPALKFTEWMASPWFHKVAAGICCGIVAMAIWPAFLKFRDYRILSLSSLGLGLILSAAFFLPDECCSEHSQTAGVSSEDCSGVCCAKESTIASAHEHEHGHGHGHGHGHEHEHGQTDAASVQLAGIGSIQPWMTPLGGVLLIAAHGLNLHRRRKCDSVRCLGNCDSTVL
ncbi:MAG: MerC domain-containing protein [Planctomycetota bacterium]|jgi:hypothetical protein